MKTVRFAEVVRKSGAPETYQLWLPVAKDPVFQKAVKQHRVLTLHRENVGTKKEYGIVGFREEPHAQWLVFPRSLRAFDGRRVIGVKYELLAAADQPEPPRKNSRKGLTTKSPRPAKARPARDETAPAEVVGFEPSPPATQLEPEPIPSSKPKVVPAAKEPPAAARSPAAKTSKGRGAAVSPAFLRELRHAVRELKSGKAVAAYERLQQLLKRAEQDTG